MTAARQERKSRHKAFERAIGGILALLSIVDPARVAVGSPTTELVVVNRHTGLAIDGFDPVAYFTDAAPILGRAELEWHAGGATWRFRNEGNRVAFAAAADVYIPQFGGHDPVALSRGAITDGNPSVWLVADGRLFLFYSDEARTAFAADPQRAMAAAERNWRQVRGTLVP